MNPRRIPDIRRARKVPRAREAFSGVSSLYRSVAGTIAASLTVQLSLVLSGVASARLLGVVDRGHLALFILLGTVLPIIVSVGLPLSLTYWIAQTPQAGHDLLRRVRPLIAWQLGILVIVHAAVLYVVFRNARPYVQHAAIISLLGSPAVALWGFGLAVLQGNRQFRALNLSRMVSPPLNAALMFTLLLVGERSLVLATTVWTAMIWLTAVITVAAARRGVQDRRTAPGDQPLPPVGTLLRFGLKAMLGSVTPLEGFQLDQAIVGLFISPAALGIYVVGVAFTNLTRFISQSIGTVAYPHVAADRAQRDRFGTIARFMAMTVSLCGASVIVVEVCLPFLLPRLFGAAFRPAIAVARILLISALLFALRRVLSECARGADRPGLGSIAEVISLITLIPAVLLLQGDGARGVATALVIAAGAGLVGIVVGFLVRSPRQPESRSGTPPDPAHTDASLMQSAGADVSEITPSLAQS